MPKNIFISFDHDDADQVGGFKSIKSNTNHPLDFNDHSLEEPVTGKTGKPLTFPPDDPRSKPVRDVIKKKFDECSKLVVLIGPKTHSSDWVHWEIVTFFEKKKSISGDNTWKRIRGMRLKGHEDAKKPNAIGGRATKTMNWDPEELNNWLDKDINK